MSSFRIRPRFEQIIELDIETTRERISSHINREGSRCVVKNFPGFIGILIPEHDQHFWSPQLHLSLYTEDPGKTIIRGTYGPNPNVWSLFLYGYLIVGTLGLFAATLGFAQCMIGNTPWGLWIFGATSATAALLYFTAQIGQKLGAQQTFLLHQTYESAIGQSARIH
jgi:hypothetical protein